MTVKSTNKTIIINSNYLWLLTLSYTMVMTFANWFDARLISILNVDTDAGTLIFPITFLISDLITEVYGFKFARRAIWLGFLFNSIFIFYGFIVTHLPSPNFTTKNALFDAIITLNARIMLASMLSYLIAETLNAFLLAKIKIKLDGRYMSVRFFLSTLFAAAIDSIIFSMIAFYHSIQFNHLLALMFSMWIVKVTIETIGLPISVTLARKLKSIEQIDMYDYETPFNLFSFNTVYQTNANASHQ